VARILICGSLAYDDLGFFTTPWAPTLRNVKLERLDRGFGGCAMNIAYNLAGLGHEAVPLVYAGDDYLGDYVRHVTAAGISEAGIFVLPGTPSARGIVLTGSDGVQFTAFYPGPSGLERWHQDLEELLTGAAFAAAVVAPDLPEKMVGCARRLQHLPLLVWCPGQYAEMLSADEVGAVLEATQLLVVNRHEWDAICSRFPGEQAVRQVRHVIVTDGPGPVTILPAGETVLVPAQRDQEANDPTGCGDAFVAALVDALLRGADATAAVAAASGLAGRCLGYVGAQAHPVAPELGLADQDVSLTR
jgi:adenosine kinase